MASPDDGIWVLRMLSRLVRRGDSPRYGWVVLVLSQLPSEAHPALAETLKHDLIMFHHGLGPKPFIEASVAPVVD